MKHVEISAIKADAGKRFRFLSEFVGFTEKDWESLRESVPVLAPHLPRLLDALYDHLLSYDDARRIFLGSTGEVDPAYLAVRKEHLTEWFLETAGAVGAWERFPAYLSQVARMHTAHGGDPARMVPPRYLVGLICFIQGALLDLVFDALPLEPWRARRYGTAWIKMLGIQLEMFLKEVGPSWPNWDEPATGA